MYLLIVLKISKSLLSETILTNLQPISCSFAFCLFVLWSIFPSRCVHFSQFVFRAYSHENISKSYNLKHYYYVCMFSPSSKLIIFVSNDCSCVKMILYCLNPNLVLNLCAYVVLEYIITLIANFSSIKILLNCIFGSPTRSYICFVWSECYLIVIYRKFLWLYPSTICFLFNHNIPSQPENIGPQDVRGRPPPTSPERPLKILFDHPRDVEIWRFRDDLIWRPGDVLKWRTRDVLI